MEDDSELAPLVDGLSSALAVITLIIFVFMINSINTIVKGESQSIRFMPSYLDDKNVINFDLGINLSESEIKRLNKLISESHGNTVELDFIISKDKTGNYIRIAQLAYIDLSVKLKGLNKHIKIGTIAEGICPNNYNISCINWKTYNEK